MVNQNLFIMKNLLLTLTSISFFLIFGCSPNRTSNQSIDGISTADTLNNSAWAVNIGSLENRNYIKTSELFCKVKDVQKTTTQVFGLVNSVGGLVLHSAVTNNIIKTEETKISSDSILVAQYFETSNELTFKVPKANFERTLEALQPMMGFVETFNINAEDVSLNLLESKMSQNRFKEFEKDIKPKANKFKDVKSLYEAKNEADRNKITELKTKDDVAYSTIVLKLKQPIRIYKETKPNIENTRLDKPIFFARIFNGLKDGTYIVEEIVVFLSQFWLLIVAGILGFKIYKKKMSQKV
jgi:Domain of unknown function (DUF4349)